MPGSWIHLHRKCPVGKRTAAKEATEVVDGVGEAAVVVVDEEEEEMVAEEEVGAAAVVGVAAVEVVVVITITRITIKPQVVGVGVEEVDGIREHPCRCSTRAVVGTNSSSNFNRAETFNNLAPTRAAVADTIRIEGKAGMVAVVVVTAVAEEDGEEEAVVVAAGVAVATDTFC